MGMRTSTRSWLGLALAGLAGCSLNWFGDGQPPAPDGGPSPPTWVDAPVDSGCYVLAQTGCHTGEKCTWIRVSTGAAEPEQLGQVGCAPAGSVDIGGACAWGDSGVATGYDNCVEGAICIASPASEMAQGICQPICSLFDATLPCSTDLACDAVPKFFTNNTTDPPAAGICQPTCDPLTQLRDSDGAPACGSSNPTAPDRGCYGLPSRDERPTVFTCDSVDPSGCAPGSVPLLSECTAYCDPMTINNTTPSPNRFGRPPYSCPEVGATGSGVRCLHLWFWESGSTPLSIASNDFGFCIDFTGRTWDDDANPATPEVPWPLPETRIPYTDPPATAGPEHDLFWGAAPYPTSLTGAF